EAMEGVPCSVAPQKRWKLLLGAVLVAWLLLVHLLVNIWLLLLLSAIMAAVGAWLGPQLILGCTTPIHLERFLTLDLPGPRGPDAEAQLDKELELLVQKIVQDFVSSWYRRLGPGTAFEDQVREVMLAVAMETKRRLSLADRHQVTRKLLTLAGRHLQCYKWAKTRVQGLAHLPPEREELLLWDAYQELSPAHPALPRPSDEVDHARRLVQVLLSELVPRPHLETRTGRHLVVELIACNVLLPLAHRMSDPDWLNVVLTNILSKTPLRLEEEEPPVVTPPIPKTLPLEPPPQLLLLTPADTSADFPDPERDDAHLPEEAANGAEEPPPYAVRYLQPPNPSSPFFLCEESEPESPMSDLTLERPLMNSTEDLLSDCGLDSLTPAESPGGPPHDEGLGGQQEEGAPPRPEILIESSEFGPAETSPTATPTTATPLITSSPTATPIHPFSFVPLSSPDGPVLIHNLRITGTITAREHSGTGSHPYTLYTIKYDTALDSQSLGSLQPMAYHTVNRRYREFLNLQTRLEERNDLRKFIKHIKGPKKFLPDLPFGNMDSDKVEARKSLLESFLRQLCAVPEIGGSEEVQEFLALNTDARIAFVKKPLLVSRIDKMVVSAIVDTLKTAFPRSEPQSPTEELSESEGDAKCPGDCKR
ncbi:sorting nexin-19-like, partial [Gastrophryne carolinensis]